MHIDLSKRHAIVTGSTAGIGLAIARGLAAAGAQVVVTGRTQARVDEAIAGIAGQVVGARLSGVAGDLGTREGAEKLVAAVPQTDILVNNLGIFEPKAFFEEHSRRGLAAFLRGQRDERRAAGTALRAGYGAARLGARAVRFQRVGGADPRRDGGLRRDQTAQLAVSRGLAETLAGTGVTVNAILPGPTRSEGVGDFFGKIAAEQGAPLEQVERDFIATHRPSSLIKRLATVDEVASLAVYLASEQASATTGAAMRVDGGVLRSVV